MPHFQTAVKVTVASGHCRSLLRFFHFLTENGAGDFDIHAYGTQILDKFPEGNRKTTIKFQDVISESSPEEVSRLFLSSLMLANTQNLEIECTGIYIKYFFVKSILLLENEKKKIRETAFYAYNVFFFQ